MKVVALVSGGKDSCMNMIQCEKFGHKVVALANLYPADEKVDELDSHMYQTVGHHAISVYAACTGLPLFRRKIKGKSLQLGMEYDKKKGDEVEDLRILLQAVKKQFPDVQGVSCGAILSDYQRLRVEAVCASLGLTSLAYLWQRNQTELLKEMLAVPIEAIIIKVAAAGLEPDKHLGMTIAEVAPTLFALDKKFGSHVCGEGGEYETFVLDCPMFKAKIVLEETRCFPHPSGDPSVAFLHLDAFHIEPKPGVAPQDAMTAVVEEVQDPTDAAPAAAQPEAPAGPAGAVAVSRGDAMWTFQYRPAVNAGGSDVEQLLAALHALSKEMKASGVGWPDSLMVHLYLKDMSHFAAVNAAYIRVVPATAPPARACVEACLPEGVLVSVDVLARAPGQSASKRGCLHVQSVSSWAPACIGPYAQGTRAMGLVHLAGQIGLDPPTMQLREGPHQAAQAAANASAVAACLKAPLETCALYCTIYALDQGELVAGAAAWNFLLDAPPQPAGARSDDPDADPEGGPAWRQKWRPPVTYVVVPHLPRGACVEVEPVALYAKDGEWGADTDESSTDKIMAAMLRSETVRPASVGLGGAQLKSTALYSQGRFCRSQAALVWPKDAQIPGSGPAGEDEEGSMHLADAVAQGVIRALAANLHYAGLGWADAFTLRVYAAKGVVPGLAKGAPDGMRRLQDAFDAAFASGGMFMGGGGAAAGEGSGPKKVPIAVVVPVEACGTTPEAEAGIVAEVVALRIVAGSGSAA